MTTCTATTLLRARKCRLLRERSECAMEAQPEKHINEMGQRASQDRKQKHLNYLEYDFAGGLCLIMLLEVLSGKKFAKFNPGLNFRTQKLESVTICLKFLENDEGIRIVNMGECFSYVCWELSLYVNLCECA